MPHTTPIQLHRAEDYKTACDWAKTVLKAGSGPRAVVFDVDDTLITKQGEPIQQVLDLVAWCRSQTDLKCVIVTAREQVTDWSMHLNEALTGKIDGQWDVYLREKGSADDWNSVMSYKFNARQDVRTKHGIPVVLTVGDMWWDVAHPNDDSFTYEQHELNKEPQTYCGQRPEGEAFVKLGKRVVVKL